MKILAVDDDEIILELLSATLEAYGFDDVELASGGEEALKKIAESSKTFDCFMFDIQMPGMDGTELCRAVRQLADYHDTPVVMITAMNNKEYFDKAFASGATDYVTKPFDVTELITRIRLAERLQTEFQRVAMADPQSREPREKIEGNYETPISIGDVKGVVTTTVIQNYVEQMLRARNLAIQLIALKIPQLELVFEASDFSEFSYVVADVADVVSDVMEGYQVFTSYFGAGVFVCVGPADEMLDRKTLRASLIRLLNDSDLVYSEDVETKFSAIIGTYCSPGSFRTVGAQELFGIAIDKVENAQSGSLLKRAFSLITIGESQRVA
jgi:CheY-like chemotaxis protein